VTFPPKKLINDKRTILIVLIAGIGDIVLGSKSIMAIRRGWPDAEIHLLTSTEAAAIAQNYEFLDKVWTFPIREIKQNKLFLIKMLKIALKLREMKFDTAINMYQISSLAGAIKMALLFFLVQAKQKIGQDHKFFSLLLDEKIPEKNFHMKHIADAMTDIAILAGGKPADVLPEIYWQKKSENKWSKLFPIDAKASNHIRVGINPGGDLAAKRWNPSKFADVANRLSETFNIELIILGGPTDKNIAKKIKHKLKYRYIDLSGRLSINDLVYVVSQLDLLITNDSGPMHIGAALNIPIVAVFGPESRKKFYPYTSVDEYVVLNNSCKFLSTPFETGESFQSIDQISSDRVFEASKKFILKKQETKQ